MLVGVPSEMRPDERRVALVPAVLPGLRKRGLEVILDKGAGERAGFPDALYEEQGARVVTDRDEVFSSADLILRVRGFGKDGEEGSSDLERVRPGRTIIGLLDPLGDAEGARGLAEKRATAFALELLPRITRAQPMDALTAMATVVGYKAVLLAAGALPKMYPMMITAAGTITPAKVFVVGAGVAGLQAIATSRRLGAVVQAYDIRPAVKEQVESLGARFVEMDLDTGESEAEGGYARAMGDEFYRRQREMMGSVVAESDVVITTAAVPGKKAPILVTGEMVRGMRPGSVVVDLAAETGGNCELTRPGETVDVDGVSILGPRNLPSTIPFHASQMYARNCSAFLENLVKDGEIRVDREDPIIGETLVTHEGEVVNARVRERLGLAVPDPAKEERSGS